MLQTRLGVEGGGLKQARCLFVLLCLAGVVANAFAQDPIPTGKWDVQVEPVGTTTVTRVTALGQVIPLTIPYGRESDHIPFNAIVGDTWTLQTNGHYRVTATWVDADTGLPIQIPPPPERVGLRLFSSAEAGGTVRAPGESLLNSVTVNSSSGQGDPETIATTLTDKWSTSLGKWIRWYSGLTGEVQFTVQPSANAHLVANVAGLVYVEVGMSAEATERDIVITRTDGGALVQDGGGRYQGDTIYSWNWFGCVNPGPTLQNATAQLVGDWSHYGFPVGFDALVTWSGAVGGNVVSYPPIQTVIPYAGNMPNEPSAASHEWTVTAVDTDGYKAEKHLEWLLHYIFEDWNQTQPDSFQSDDLGECTHPLGPNGPKLFPREMMHGDSIEITFERIASKSRSTSWTISGQATLGYQIGPKHFELGLAAEYGQSQTFEFATGQSFTIVLIANQGDGLYTLRLKQPYIVKTGTIDIYKSTGMFANDAPATFIPISTWGAISPKLDRIDD